MAVCGSPPAGTCASTAPADWSSRVVHLGPWTASGASTRILRVRCGFAPGLAVFTAFHLTRVGAISPPMAVWPPALSALHFKAGRGIGGLAKMELVGSRDGLFRLDETVSHGQTKATAVRILEGSILALLEDSRGRVWIGSIGGGGIAFDGNQLKTHRVEETRGKGTLACFAESPQSG